MAVRMIKAANKRGTPFFKVADVASAMDVSEGEIRELVAYCDALDWRTVGNEAAIKVESRNTERFLFLRNFIESNAVWLFWLVFCMEEEAVEDIIEVLKEYVRKSVNDEEQEFLVAQIRKAINLYGEIYVNAIEEMRAKDYDWAIITEMLGDDNTWKTLFEDETADVNFVHLKGIVERGI